MAPTVVPTERPSKSPSESPTQAPSDFQNGKRAAVETGVTMDLRQAQPLGEESSIGWQEVTAQHIQDVSFRQMGGAANVETISVTVLLKSQSPPYEPPLPAGRRRLQGQLLLTFEVELEVRSNLTNIDLRQYIRAGFENEGVTQNYIDGLRGIQRPELRDVVFGSITLREPPVPESGDSVLSNPGVIVGIVMVVVSGLAMVGFYFYMRRRRSQRKKHDDAPPLTHIGIDSGKGDYASEIEIQTKGDVSALTIEPYGMLSSDPSAGQSVTDTLDYDFQRAYRNEGVSSVGDSTNQDITVPKDDDTFDAHYFAEDHFEVVAPPGMLGLVLETSADGVPTVHAIKNTSALASEVQVGDRLLSVDGEDVTVMLASDVSRLIAAKRDNSSRRFIFSRVGRPSDN